MQQTYFIGIIIFSIILTIFGLFSYALLQKYFKEKILHTKKIYDTIVAAQENERQRLAKDIHDELGGLLTTIGFYAHNLLENKYKTEEEKNQSITEIINLTKKANIEAKNVSYALTPDSLMKYGLNGAINEVKNRVIAANHITFEISYEVASNLALAAQLHLYRIIAELVNNAVKYAQCKCIYIDLFEKNEKLYLQVKDDGIGFDLNAVTKNGIDHVISRAKALEGGYSIESTKENGSIFIFEFSLKSVTHSNN